MESTTTSNTEWHRQRLVEAARLLAASYEQQIAALPGFVHVPDELLLEFGEAFLLAPQMLKVGLITARQFALAQDLDQACEAVPVIEDHETALADVRDAPVWADLRQKARDLLTELDEPVTPPDPSYNVYVGPPKRMVDNPAGQPSINVAPADGRFIMHLRNLLEWLFAGFRP